MILPKNKKGLTKLLGVSIDLILTMCVIIVLVFFVIVPLYNIFTSTPNQGTTETFAQIDSQIKNNLIAGTSTEVTIPFYIQDNKMIVAFNKGEVFARWQFPLLPDATISRPKQPAYCSEANLNSGSCLCVCNNHYDNKNACTDDAWSCVNYPTINKIVADPAMAPECNYGIERQGAGENGAKYLVILGDTAAKKPCRTQTLTITLKDQILYFNTK